MATAEQITALVASVQEFAIRLQLSEQNVVATVTALQATQVELVGRVGIDASLQAIAKGMGKGEKGKDLRLVDTSGIGKPTYFKGKDSEFIAWSRKLKNVVGNIFPDLMPAIEWTEED